jgi:hypothetical protein
VLGEKGLIFQLRHCSPFDGKRPTGRGGSLFPSASAQCNMPWAAVFLFSSAEDRLKEAAGWSGTSPPGTPDGNEIADRFDQSFETFRGQKSVAGILLDGVRQGGSRRIFRKFQEIFQVGIAIPEKYMHRYISLPHGSQRLNEIHVKGVGQGAIRSPQFPSLTPEHLADFT